MEKKNYKIVIGGYCIKAKEGTPVVFKNGAWMDLGILKEGNVICLNNKTDQEEVLMKPFHPMECFPVGERYVEGMWDYFSTLWQLAAGIKKEPEKIYKGKPLQEADLALWDDIEKGNWNFLETVDRAQKESGELCYRYLDFPYADGKAIYQMTGICGTMAKIVRCQGLGDDWEIPEYGNEAVIPLSQALQVVGRRDKMGDWMEKKREKQTKRKFLYD